eukprot:TRINITY_DN1697_c0_g1_i1.p1 TRINITY_DN1697_c0_g1~~TRINITY_DN1697_c0_g1_i1.p1  ORF type:complete len:122 (-),score=25.52 TRINITY_DN1697_c0_g1_i1:160-525(-)
MNQNQNQNHNQNSNVLVLSQMVTTEDLKDDEEYKEIVHDIRDECSKYGTLKSITIPRPAIDCDNEQEMVQGLGKVFVEFEAIQSAQKAREALQGRTFQDRVVVAHFYDAHKYAEKDFALTA